MRTATGMMMVAALAAAIGCEGNISTTPETADVGAAPAPPAPTPPGNGGGAQATPAASSGPAVPPKAAPSGAGNLELATAKSGAKGRDYGGAGFITTPIQEYFRAEARINLLHMDNTLKNYKAAHDNKGPKTHDEFMKVIIEENQIQLPELPVGEEYLYDPKTEQLMVRRPEK